jgi:hypothetical protein
MVLTTVSHEGIVAVAIRRFPTKAMAEECGETALDAVNREFVKHADYEIEQISEEVPR